MKTLLKISCLILALCMLCSCSRLAENKIDDTADSENTTPETDLPLSDDNSDDTVSDTDTGDDTVIDTPEPQISLPENTEAFHAASDNAEIFAVINGSAEIPYGMFPPEASSADGRMTVIALNGFMSANAFPSAATEKDGYVFSVQQGNLVITQEDETVYETEVFTPEYTIGGDEDNATEFYYGDETPMALYLTESTLAIVTSAYSYTELYDEETESWSYSNSHSVNTYIFDVSDVNAPSLVNTLTQDGAYAASSVTGGRLSVISSWLVNHMDESDIATYIPHVGDSPISPENIHIFDYSTCSGYTIIAEYDVAEAAVASSAAVLGGSGRMYMDETDIYFIFFTETASLTGTQTQDGTEIENYTESCMSAVIKFPMGGDLTPAGQTLLSGCFGNDFSIYTKDGNLFFCAVAEKSHYAILTKDGQISKKDISAEIENVLYNISPDLKTVTYNFLPNEEISYAMFDGDYVWVGYFKEPMCFDIYTAEPVTGIDPPSVG